MSEIKTFVRKRIGELRIKKGVSENKMSLELGRNGSYISNLSYQNQCPSMESLTEICKYFNITLSQFFDSQNKNPLLINKIIDECKNLSDEDLTAVYHIVKRMNSSS